MTIIQDEWIEHDGKSCPVEPNVKVWLRSSGYGDSKRPYPAHEVQWDNTFRQVQLIAYKVVKEGEGG